MTTTILGDKRICAHCSAKFYDLGANPAACPKCKKLNDKNAPVKIRRKSKVVVQVDADDPLLKQKAKQDEANKRKKPSKFTADADDFGVETLDGDDIIEEIDEMSDIESMDELDIEEGDEAEEILDEDEIGDEALVDDLEEEIEEEEDEKPAKPSKSKKKG